MSISAVFCAFFAMGAVLMDLKWEKVPNSWCLFGWFASVSVQLMTALLQGGRPDLWRIIFGTVFPLILLFPLFAAKMLGTGDIKVFAVLGSMIGMRTICRCIILSFLLGAIIALPVLFLCCDYKRRIFYFFSYLQRVMDTKMIPPYLVPGNAPENLHFTLPIFCSVWLLILGGFI